MTQNQSFKFAQYKRQLGQVEKVVSAKERRLEKTFTLILKKWTIERTVYVSKDMRLKTLRALLAIQ